MRPTKRSILVFLLGVPLAFVVGLIDTRLWTVWLLYLVVLIVLLCLDVLAAMPKRSLKVAVTAPPQIFTGEIAQATVSLTAQRWRRQVIMEMIAELSEELVAGKLVQMRLLASADSRDIESNFALKLQPLRRGEASIIALHLRWKGPLGLVEKSKTVICNKAIGVVPNIGAVRAIALRMFGSQDFMAGLKVERFAGTGTEFESLREYQAGLDHRAIDWKASARHRKLLTQEFRAERNHQVIIAIDSGQLMTEPLGGATRVDHAINAGLVLGWFCLRTGDRVGFTSFDERTQSFAEPIGGVSNFVRLQRLSAEIEYRNVETNFALSLADISARLRRRSLIVLFTDFVDTVTAELMIENITHLARRHVMVFVSLRDPSLDSRALANPASLQALHESVVATDFVRERALVLERLKQVGVHCIDATPQTFSAHLINRYLDIKRRELI